MDWIYNQIVVGKQKAIVAFILASLTAFLAKQGFTLDTTIGELAEALIYGIIGYIGVYIKRNK